MRYAYWILSKNMCAVYNLKNCKTRNFMYMYMYHLFFSCSFIGIKLLYISYVIDLHPEYTSYVLYTIVKLHYKQ